MEFPFHSLELVVLLLKITSFNQVEMVMIDMSALH